MKSLVQVALQEQEQRAADAPPPPREYRGRGHPCERCCKPMRSDSTATVCTACRTGARRGVREYNSALVARIVELEQALLDVLAAESIGAARGIARAALRPGEP